MNEFTVHLRASSIRLVGNYCRENVKELYANNPN